MLAGQLRKFLLLFTLPFIALGLVACGGGSSHTPGPVTPPAPTTGSLTVNVTGLPSGLNAAIRVTGPGNYLLDLTQPRTLGDLAPGSYNIAAAAVTSGTTTYQPTPASQSAVVSAGTTTSAAVVYASAALTLGVTDVVSGLDNPTWLAVPPGDTRLFVTERPGLVRIVDNGSTRDLPYLDIRSRIATAGEGGLLSLAFDPRFQANGYFYVYYTDPQRNIVVERFSAGATPNQANPTSGLVILRIAHATYTNHFGGQLAFGPDGYLYLGTGDGGGAGDPLGNARNLDSLLGKLLRIDVAGATLAQPYTIPPTNPYRNQAGRRPEIWASGLRNPWRFSFDGSQLYLSDVGQDQREEVNLAGAAQAGLDYGWNVMEGSQCYNAATCDRTGLTLPVFDYDHGTDNANGCSITGGFVYGGRAVPELAGRYFYSDFCGGYLKSFVASDGGILDQRDWNLRDIGRVVSFGQDADGELYLIAASGTIHKIGRGATQ